MEIVYFAPSNDFLIHSQSFWNTVHNSTEENVSSYEAEREWIKGVSEPARVTIASQYLWVYRIIIVLHSGRKSM
jgi:hypothetical protein